MSVSKRVRFEVLRRDNHACRYCGQTAPDVKLTVDHVVPVALGGSDDPSNLVTACTSCNSGKSSIHPDQAIVDDVAGVNLAFAAAMQLAIAELEQANEARDDYVHQFDTDWLRYTIGSEHLPRPVDWDRSISSFHRLGLPLFVLTDAVAKAMFKSDVAADQVFRYVCGIAWSTYRELHARATELTSEGAAGTEEQPAENDRLFDWRHGYRFGRYDMRCDLRFYNVGYADEGDDDGYTAIVGLLSVPEMAN